jgi:5,10-methylenetetrahydromethanopterin reductase
VEISCSFATSLDTPEHIALAEGLGYRRAWCYDSPALYADVWMTLALAAERTTRIGLGPAVLVPSLRHVMTTAAAIATLTALAPGRVAVGVGAGLTGRLALGRRPLPWREVAAYLRTLRALLRGEEVEWEGAVIRMLHRPGFAPPRPIDVPLLVGAQGPKGEAMARELADGLLTLGPRPPAGFSWVAEIVAGTVLEEGEAPGSARALAAAGHAGAFLYHSMYDGGQGWGDFASLPGGAVWRQRAEAVPARTRHLAIHEGHIVGLNALDTGVVSGELLAATGMAQPRAGWQAQLAARAQAGVTELIYAPAGPDIERELTAFAAMAGIPSAAPPPAARA